MINKILRYVRTLKHKIINIIKDKTGYNKVLNQYVDALTNFYQLVTYITKNKISGSKLKPSLKIKNILEIAEEERRNDCYKFLAQELESILKTMKVKGTHPQDILTKVVREAKKKSSMELECPQQ